MFYSAFLRGLLSDPRGVSAPAPSSAALAAAMAAKVDPLRPGLIVELGAGTGVVTKALLDRGIARSRLFVIEQNTVFIGLLRARFPGVTVIEGDAFALKNHLPPDAQISAIVSGVPLLNFPVPSRRALIEQALALQGPGGRFIQLSYGWQPPVQLKNGSPAKTVVWRNILPAHIWTFGAQAAPAKRLRPPQVWRQLREWPSGFTGWF